MNELFRMALEVEPEEMGQLTPRERRTIRLIRLTVALQDRMASGEPLTRRPKKAKKAGGPQKEASQRRAAAQQRRVRGAKEGRHPARRSYV
jgi:hypothetical protein